ncbi:hypothetical protein [Nocardia sp. XZ_19_369]|uniref:hypothetical protein n=1 Tax=Nocardia sp. XZ_19_369 TaxID=2769487 RepID=UPI00188DC8DF|nr:hypothetical protein [Nocardia sp. XZ_19_369]
MTPTPDNQPTKPPAAHQHSPNRNTLMNDRALTTLSALTDTDTDTDTDTLPP